MKQSLLLLLTITLLCAGFSSNVSAQAPLEVVLVASSHGNPSKPEKYRPIIDKLKAYQPDMVFGEYMLPAELKAANDSTYGRYTFMPRYRYILRRTPVMPKNLAREISKQEKTLRKSPDKHTTRIELARNYVLAYDRANAEYQLHILEKVQKPKFSPADLAHFDTVLGGADSLRKVKLLRPGTEYDRIYFPLVYELGQRVYPMDCQKYDKEWSQEWSRTAVAVEALKARVKADSTSAEALTAKKIQAAVVAYRTFGDDIKPTETLTQEMIYYQFMNTPAYDAVDEAMNFYGGEALYGMPGFPTESVKGMKVQYERRNQGMCENIVRQARQQGAKKVIVGVGASHGKGMREILAAMPGVKVISYNDLP
ncbi:hypothetical protein [Hymenobacter radiodurans]|uniref:hypothetical protein n=1 Tax=Hymenobacter radiodurans TaxID=2496028 RepID=UPI0010583FBF|nr:hypothetical protein [Hymenobacter radiodurans]